MSMTALNVALLAPVPLEHLQDGQEVCANESRVAFGSRAWEVFRQLDALRQGLPVDVYIYASHTRRPLRFEVSWAARYIGHVESVDGTHPQGMRFRPPSTARYLEDNQGHWAIFWEVEDLRELPPAERTRLAHFTAFNERRAYGHNFVPEGPLLIEHP